MTITAWDNANGAALAGGNSVKYSPTSLAGQPMDVIDPLTGQRYGLIPGGTVFPAGSYSYKRYMNGSTIPESGTYYNKTAFNAILSAAGLPTI